MPKSQKKKHYDWVVWPLEYFALALIGIKFLKELLPKEPFTSGLKEEFNFSQPTPYLIIPIIYNFKHGIELYLKGIGNIWDQDYEHSHDLIFLLNTLINKLNKDEKLIPVAKILEIQLRPFIEKYYFGLYIKNNEFKSMPDSQNEAERYPENKGYSIPNIWHETLPNNETLVVDLELIENIDQDIRKVENILHEEVYLKVSALSRL